MNYAQLNGYLRRCYQWLHKGPGREAAPFWLPALSYGWVTKDTVTLERAHLMPM